MNKKSAKKAIALYYCLSFLLTLPLLIPIWLIKEPILMIVYLICFLIYMRIAINFVVQKTIMSSIWKDLDAEKYAAIINVRPFFPHYSYKLNLYFVTGDYQAAYDCISSILLKHKNVQQRIYGHLLLCRICFERGDYEGLKENFDEIDNFFKYNTNIKLLKQNKEAYDFYRTFLNADYESVCALLEKSIEKYSKNKNRTYFTIVRQYQLAVTKRKMGKVEESIALFESVREKAPKLYLSTLAQKQLDYINGTVEETAPERLANTENYNLQAHRKSKTVVLIAYCVAIFLIIVGVILIKLDSPKQEDKDLEYIAGLEGSIKDEYDEYNILGYFNIYSDYADKTYSYRIDSLFLVEANGKLDLHTVYKLNGEYENLFVAKDIQANKLCEYKLYFSPKKVEFILIEKKRDIPKNSLYYYEIDGYYFCVMSITDI